MQLAGVEALPLSLQARLSRALGENPRGVATSRLQARVIASTDRELSGLVASGAFVCALILGAAFSYFGDRGASALDLIWRRRY